jgi:hypothetical protein
MICLYHCALPTPQRVLRREGALALAALLLGVLALAGPALPQAARYHDFADQRAWGALPHALDVLSNVPFALWGVAGLVALVRALRLRAVDGAQAGLAALFFAGLIVTAGVSSYYHCQPDDAGLAWDRGGMVLAFAGLLGLAARQVVSRRAGIWLAAAVLALGLASVRVWAVTGNLLPWALLQGGGMVFIGVAAWLRPVQPESGLPIRWALVIALYALAKGLELADQPVFELTGQLVSGHSLKHVVASFSAWPVWWAMNAAVALARQCLESSAKSALPFLSAGPANAQPGPGAGRASPLSPGATHEC